MVHSKKLWFEADEGAADVT